MSVGTGGEMRRAVRVDPGGILPEEYFATRYATLRKPLGFPLGSERIVDDCDAVHAWVETEDGIVAVGRAHLIPSDSDGSAADHAGPNAATCPAFDPLNGMDGFPNPESLRPAFQIRQMGTLEQWRRKGCAGDVLTQLERGASEVWGCASGWLQARIDAIPFYKQMGWKTFGDTYDVAGIGDHVSMYKLCN